MFKIQTAFSGYAVNDLEKATHFYKKVLGLKVEDKETGISLQLPNGGELFIYPKSDHQPATFTVLNFVVDNIDDAVEELSHEEVAFEHYDMAAQGGPTTDDKGVARGLSGNMGRPDVAWFKDPAGNILSIMQDK